MGYKSKMKKAKKIAIKEKTTLAETFENLKEQYKNSKHFERLIFPEMKESKEPPKSISPLDILRMG